MQCFRKTTNRQQSQNERPQAILENKPVLCVIIHRHSNRVSVDHNHGTA